MFTLHSRSTTLREPVLSDLSRVVVVRAGGHARCEGQHAGPGQDPHLGQRSHIKYEDVKKSQACPWWSLL